MCSYNNSGEAMVDELSEEEAANFVVRAGVSAERRHTATDLEKRRQVRVDITGHARIKYVGNYQSCMVLNGRLIPHASAAGGRDLLASLASGEQCKLVLPPHGDGAFPYRPSCAHRKCRQISVMHGF